METHGKDNIFLSLDDTVEPFVFDEKVAGVFDDMIHRSVPGYGLVIKMLEYLAGEYVQDNSNCYDLGCSLGASTLAVRRAVRRSGLRIIAVDNSEAMIKKCRQNVEKDLSPTPVDTLCEDIAHVEITRASFVILNFSLQFFRKEKRAELIQKIYDGMCPGGVLVLSEKIAFEDTREQVLQTEMHHEFKRLNGYSDLEISRKRTALEDVLIPDTYNTHVKRLKDAGFKQVYKWFQCFNFMSIVALK